jgi:hypothetical protein
MDLTVKFYQALQFSAVLFSLVLFVGLRLRRRVCSDCALTPETLSVFLNDVFAAKHVSCLAVVAFAFVAHGGNAQGFRYRRGNSEHKVIFDTRRTCSNPHRAPWFSEV